MPKCMWHGSSSFMSRPTCFFACLPSSSISQITAAVIMNQHPSFLFSPETQDFNGFTDIPTRSENPLYGVQVTNKKKNNIEAIKYSSIIVIIYFSRRGGKTADEDTFLLLCNLMTWVNDTAFSSWYSTTLKFVFWYISTPLVVKTVIRLFWPSLRPASASVAA